MKMLLRLLPFLFCLRCLGISSVTFTIVDAEQNPVTNRQCYVQAFSMPTATSSSIPIGSKIPKTTDVNGQFLLNTPVLSQLYQTTVTAPPQQSIFTIYLPSSLSSVSGTVSASVYMVANSSSTFPAGSVAWAAATSDLRYISVSNNTVNGYQIYATNGTYFWAPAGGGSGGSGTVTQVSGPDFLTWATSTSTPVATVNATTAKFSAIRSTNASTLNSVTAMTLGVTNGASIRGVTDGDFFSATGGFYGGLSTGGLILSNVYAHSFIELQAFGDANMTGLYDVNIVAIHEADLDGGTGGVGINSEEHIRISPEGDTGNIYLNSGSVSGGIFAPITGTGSFNIIGPLKTTGLGAFGSVRSTNGSAFNDAAAMTLRVTNTTALNTLTSMSLSVTNPVVTFSTGAGNTEEIDLVGSTLGGITSYLNCSPAGLGFGVSSGSGSAVIDSTGLLSANNLASSAQTAKTLAIFNASKVLTSLAVPTDGQTIVADSSQSLGWKATNFPSGGGGSSSNYTGLFTGVLVVSNATTENAVSAMTLTVTNASTLAGVTGTTETFITSSTLNALTAMSGVVTNSVSVGGSGAFGTTSSAAASAIVDMTSTAKGVLIPRMTMVQIAAISSPATGLLAYDSDDNFTNGVYFYRDSTRGWLRLNTIVNMISLNNQSASIGSAALYTTPATDNQMYEISGDVMIQTASTSGTITVSFGLTDQVGAFTTSPINAVSTAGTGRFAIAPFNVSCAASSAINYSTTLVNTSGAAIYWLKLSVRKLQ